MKVSVSLPDDDIAFLDDYAKRRGDSRSAALHRAVRLLREKGLGADYVAAWQDWDADEEAAWAAVTGDGVDAQG
jgi:Arc/MetJ-type ribon-helix-helix transcriptional regulator